ncbi:hypothetical protein K491DRAFT_717912 [Lophiostoma macrostomum CBS 122681]|uniref:Guanine nucleotide binding protein, alpha subunit n=1 Tax=Lophiostoma macrostomum CBS 122681 TaxID=1314788 RepID=A0A6A6T1R9_9PLEO|nr:hypothetical protein K491DRAFT_717912 [Lophiostoma macrostomum CBS 122681]
MFLDLTKRIEVKWQKLRDGSSLKSGLQPDVAHDKKHKCKLRQNRKAADRAKERSADIDYEIAKGAEEFENRTRILILGIRHSSQSTLFRQVRYIQEGGFSPAERLEWRKMIYWSLFRVFDTVRGTELYEHLFTCLILGWESFDYLSPLPPNFVDGLQRLFALDVAAIKETCAGHFCETIRYFSYHSDRLLEPHYLPTDEDILHSYVQVGTVEEAVLRLRDGKIQIHELGQLHDLRRLKKGGYDFEATDVVLLVFPLDTYNVVRWATETEMRLDTIYYNSITSSRWFTKAAFVLCFTKLDIFRQKIESNEHPFSEFYPDYSGDPYDVNSMLEYISEMFQASVAEASGGGGILPVYYLDATKTDQVRGLLGLLEWVIANRGQ